MKIIPEKVTKAFIFEAYGDQLPEKVIRQMINYYIKLLGGNVRIKIVPDIVFISILKDMGLPRGYKASEQLKAKCEKVGFYRDYW